jgi:hypothetical protein
MRHWNLFHSRRKLAREHVDRDLPLAHMARKQQTISEILMPDPLSPDLLRKMHAYWRASNYLSVGQIYLQDNPLLESPLTLEHIKPRLLGHWGTTPGLNFIYVHLNRLIKENAIGGYPTLRVSRPFVRIDRAPTCERSAEPPGNRASRQWRKRHRGQRWQIDRHQHGIDSNRRGDHGHAQRISIQAFWSI